MTDPRIIVWPDPHARPFDSDEIDRETKAKLFASFPVLNHFIWSYGLGEVEGSIVRTALMLATAAGSYNSDTNLALRKLLEVRGLYRHTRDRLLIDDPRRK